MNKYPYLTNFWHLALNILLVYAVYAICRLCFIYANPELYAHLSASEVLHLLRSGLVFDSSAIFYTNALIILLFLFPLHWKEQKTYYKVSKWIYVVVNGLCVVLNLCDAVYFPFTGKRTTGNVLQEFENEGASNLFKIFVDQALVHWVLLLVGIALIAALWWGFSRPANYPKWSKSLLIKYYAVNILLLAGCAYLCVGMMRGGFTHAVRPITISNANQYANNPTEAGAILNTPFSLIRTFNKRPLVTPDYMTEDEAVAWFNPVQTVGNGKEFRPLNVVVLIMESFSKQHFGFYNDGENGVTPFLDSLLAQGKALTYKYSFANGRKSIEGMPSVLSGIPNFVEPFFLTPAAMNHLSGLARELSENKGYASAFFHGAENGSMGFEAFARTTGFQKYFGRTEYNADTKYNGDADYDGVWAIWDEEFLQFYADRMSEMPQPFVTAVFTATSHTPFSLPERYKDVFPKGRHPVQECVAYSDYALKRFFETAEQQPWYENTIFVITSDHISCKLDPYYTTTLGLYSVPIIFYAPGLPQLSGYDEATIVEQTDIMPTVLGILGYDKPFVAFGQDIFGTPAEEKWALHWVPELDGYEFVKSPYAVRFDGKDITAIFDFIADPLQERNIIAEVDAGTKESLKRQLEAVIQQYMQRMNADQMVIAAECPR